MNFPSPLVRGRLIQRYKRFLADVLLDDGTELTAHCPNPGSMLGLNMPGSPVWLSKSPDPKRKLAYTLELIEVEGSIPGDFVKVGLNTMLSQDTGPRHARMAEMAMLRMPDRQCMLPKCSPRYGSSASP